MSADLVPGPSAARRGHFGAWRAATAAPAMVGSLLLLLVLVGWMGQWEGFVLLGWLASGAAVFTRVGERVAVAVGYGFRRPTRTQAEVLGPLWATALARAGLAGSDVDLYVQRSCELNAYAVGGRSVAVTSGVLRQFLARRLGEDQIVAVLVHEIGHHESRATKFTLIAMWLAAPWRIASRFVIGVGLATVGRRQPMRLLSLVVVAGVVVAVVQAIQQRQWTVAVVLSAVALCAVLCPLADAAVSRRSEFAADWFAAEQGVGPQLSSALRALDRGRSRKLSWTRRALSRHPSTECRVEAIARVGA